MNWISVNSKKIPEYGQRLLVIQNPEKTATTEPLFAIWDGKDFVPPEKFENQNEWHTRWAEIIYWIPLASINQPKHILSLLEQRKVKSSGIGSKKGKSS